MELPDTMADLLAEAADVASSRPVMQAMEKEWHTLEVGGALHGKVRQSSSLKLPTAIAAELWNWSHTLPPALRTRWYDAAAWPGTMSRGGLAAGAVDRIRIEDAGPEMSYDSPEFVVDDQRGGFRWTRTEAAGSTALTISVLASWLCLCLMASRIVRAHQVDRRASRLPLST